MYLTKTNLENQQISYSLGQYLAIPVVMYMYLCICCHVCVVLYFSVYAIVVYGLFENKHSCLVLTELSVDVKGG